MTSYPGGKAGDGVYQRIINLMPPHHTYVEAFLGGAAILRHKRPAARSIVIDIDMQALVRLPIATVPNMTQTRDDAINWLTIHGPYQTPDTLIYCDPPYPLSTRTRPMYAYEMTDDDHRRLLAVIQNLPCMVMISSYASDLYFQALAGWHHTTFQAKTRGNTMATEHVWCNYPIPPAALHDYRYLGDDYRQRERIKRKITRWSKRLAAMPITERYAMLAALELGTPAPAMPPAVSPSPAMLASTDAPSDAGLHPQP